MKTETTVDIHSKVTTESVSLGSFLLLTDLNSNGRDNQTAFGKHKSFKF